MVSLQTPKLNLYNKWWQIADLAARDHCILFSVVFTLSPPSHYGSVWVLLSTLSAHNYITLYRRCVLA
jgi:hypothetical protein